MQCFPLITDSACFQVVDMRWGVRDDATNTHMTTELCLREIKACQEISVGPNFVVGAATLNVNYICTGQVNHLHAWWFVKCLCLV